MTEGLAEPMTLDVVLSPKDQIRLDFKDDDKHFVVLTQREGSAEAGGAFSGAKVVEYGLHDVIRGDGGNAHGYLEVTTSEGDVAYFKWQLRALFVAGPDGNVKVVDKGHWELTGGTGQFASMRGVGSLLLEFVNETDRRYLLEGDISPKL
ncbi:hypothetical protein [Ferruginivarius sediminum]|nr:hypothetical protein [Ferruginivarius sediminum]